MQSTILLVEDDPNDVFFMKRAMRVAGMDNPVHVATDGRQAIHYLDGAAQFSDRARFPIPALVFLDLKLPLVMGLDVLQWIRQQPALHTMIVLILTSSNQPADISKAYSLGANSYLVKPSEPLALAEIVRRLKHYWIDTNVNGPAPGCVDPPLRRANVVQSVLY